MMDDILTPMEKMDNAIKRANARAVAAQAEVERLRSQVVTLEALRDELDVTRDLLRSVPEHSAAWYADICDYLETAG